MKSIVGKDDILLETKRLFLSSITIQDLENLYPLLSDPEVMRYYPKPLSRREARKWLDRILNSYALHKVGWWAIHLKDTQAFIGQAGLLIQAMEEKEMPGLGYMLHQKYWRQGYALEAAQAVLHYGFQQLHLPFLICLVRPENLPSNRLAQKLGFKVERMVNYKGYKHWLYTMEKKATSDGPAAF